MAGRDVSDAGLIEMFQIYKNEWKRIERNECK